MTPDARRLPSPLSQYTIDREGRIYSLRSCRYMAEHIDRAGYRRASLRQDDGSALSVQIHTLILTAFVGPRPDPKAHCRHLDGNPLNNDLDNLRWGTAKENAADRMKHGRFMATRPRGEQHHAAKLTIPQVIGIYADFARGVPIPTIAKQLGILPGQVWKIAHGHQWCELYQLFCSQIAEPETTAMRIHDAGLAYRQAA